MVVSRVFGHDAVERDGLHPQLLTSRYIKAVEAPLKAIRIFGRGDEEAFAGHDRTAVAGLRHGHFPTNVLLGAPVDRCLFALRGYTRTMGSTKCRPIGPVKRLNTKRLLEGLYFNFTATPTFDKCI